MEQKRRGKAVKQTNECSTDESCSFELAKEDSDDEEPYVTFVPTPEGEPEAVTAIFSIPSPLPQQLQDQIPSRDNKYQVTPFHCRARSPSGSKTSVTIDSQFLGFTQMYPTKEGEKIEAEYVSSCH